MNQQIIQKDAALHAMALRMQRLESEVISLKSNAVAKDKRTHVLAGQASVISDKGKCGFGRVVVVVVAAL